MKFKTTFLPAGILIFVLLATSNVVAQKQNSAVAKNSFTPAIPDDAVAIYTYRVFEAPNNMFGYDIFKNERPIFHQVVLTYITDEGKRAFATKTQTQKVAALAIEKIKKGIPPTMNEAEIKKIAGQ